MSKIKAYERGLLGEYCAALFLILKGYKILALRYKTPVGEVDIVAYKNQSLIFIEVKTRARTEDALYAVNTKTQKRIEKAALHFIAYKKQFAGAAMRFDVITIKSPWRPFSIRHLDNAWEARS